jgi:hypothetical protein
MPDILNIVAPDVANTFLDTPGLFVYMGVPIKWELHTP